MADTSLAKRQMILCLHMDILLPAEVQPRPNTERIQKPKLKFVDGEVSEEDWEYFKHTWIEYQRIACEVCDTDRGTLRYVLDTVANKV